MPPKGRLPRRNKAGKNELNLEAVSEERIDAVTAEPLDPVKFIEVLSPDRTLRLFYNTSTLIRIALDKGGFMQPPHFREPMSNALRKRIESIEGKKFRFESRNSIVPTDEGGEGNGVNILHRHVYFDQIMDEFYLLSPAEVYVCPVCYEHYMKTRYLPSQLADQRTVRHLRNGKPVVDPLNVLSSMQGEDPVDGENDGSPIALNDSWDNILAHIVFRKAALWRAHMEKHHDINGVGAGDYRLRDVLCTYYNDYNQWNEEKYEDEMRQYGDSKKRTALTQQRYWHINASYNRLRYNRVVVAAELAAGHPEAVTESAFPNETIAHHFNPEDENEDDFIDDDEESERDDYIRPYSPTNDGFNDEDSEESEENDPLPARGRKRTREYTVASESDSQSSSDSASTETSSGDSEYNARVSKQRSLFKQGLLAERDCYYSRLSAEDRRFVERSQRSSVAPSQLYDPRMHQGPSKSNAVDDDVDWENIGEVLPVKHAAKLFKSEAKGLPPKEHSLTPARTTLLLDDDDTKTASDPIAAKASPNHVSRLLLDEDD
ncbi:hypothetical protein ABB37_08708 [Leptomonas pyrrhocoris]|uniref:Uncharacterized protein n=1 Tax=Leptomonas pyrrhocoris TaxID=157538 RepID=A0A0M9FSD9_LEPPY|nr:hypothetical protein ABB37_08708 [Leptomonas pyrrhocoris]KPA75017.1 hypothetical protein ABB37_08708 [Leptomonas pyrrhocoris]|eukprot:XP_015653456.1 hypothetical protein ABB37_08708 [Leptomonas pyrrhocoris]